MKNRRKVRKKKQKGSFLNRYDFAYAVRDTIDTGLTTFKHCTRFNSKYN